MEDKLPLVRNRSFTVYCDGDGCYENGEIYDTKKEAVEAAQNHYNECMERNGFAHAVWVEMEYMKRAEDSDRYYVYFDTVFSKGERY